MKPLKNIEQQIKETENRSKTILDYLQTYKGKKVYNEIALAIELGYQIALREEAIKNLKGITYKNN